MSSSGKLILFLAVIFCAVQVISARPRMDENFFKRVKYELDKKCSGLEKEMDKEMRDVSRKLEKEAVKLSKKAGNENSNECIASAKAQADDELEQKMQETQECIDELKETIESNLSPEASVGEVLSFRNAFKNKLQICKKQGKMDIKSVASQFSIAGKQCLAYPVPISPFNNQ